MKLNNLNWLRTTVYACLAALVLLPQAVAEEEVLPFPEMGPALANILRQEYYDPKRYDPELMVRRGLRSLAAANDEIAASYLQWLHFFVAR